MSNDTHFTVVFAGDLRKLGKNPFKIVSEFGEAVSVALGNALEELDEHRDETAAFEAGIPVSVKNMDSRSGGITEAEESGAPIDHIRRAATHSDVATTEGYIRGKANANANAAKNVMQMRAAHRNKPKTE